MDKNIKIMIMIAITIITCSVSYYFVIFLPDQEKAIREQQAQAEKEKINLLIQEKAIREQRVQAEEDRRWRAEKQREQAEREQRENAEKGKMNLLIDEQRRRRALAECLDRVNKRFQNAPDMNIGEARVLLPHMLELKKSEDEKCFRFYGER